MAAPVVHAGNFVLARLSKQFSIYCQLCCVRQTYVIRKYTAASHRASEAHNQSKRKKKKPGKSQLKMPSILSEEGEQALKQFDNPKSCLHNLLVLTASKGEPGYHYEYRPQEGDSLVKESILRVTWPKEFTVVGLGLRRVQAEKMAAALACVKLKAFGVLDANNKPRIPGKVLYNKDDIKEHVWKENRPDWLSIEPSLEAEIRKTLQDLKVHRTPSPSVEGIDDSLESSFDFDGDIKISDVMTSRPYEELSADSTQLRNDHLRERQLALEQDPTGAREAAVGLPIANAREEILSLVRASRVVVLCGETGCGKTTQVPQYLLEEWIKEDKGSNCNIVVTQPRRISAVSVAERVALERGEQLGESVGYQVRLSSRLPMGNGAVLFCTTGILLKKLESNPKLKGVSHVIIDEVHERDINTDFLLILLKNLLRENTDLKLMLMSASINAELLSAYFNNCPMINVPGFMYPVKEFFRPDILRMMGQRSSVSDEDIVGKPLTDVDLTVGVIEYIASNRSPGAILCFLPGWQDIKAVYDRLEKLWPNSKDHLVLPVHSSIPLSKQQGIFMRPGEGVRKIVLATNIAETSITIDDVVYVVNPGNHKEDRYDVNLGVSCLNVHWISKANVRQRKGRAGRCQPGECFHLFTQDRYNQLDDYQVPEMLRIPLEQIVVQSKVHVKDMMAADLLSKAIQPPPPPAIEKAVDILQDLGVINDGESLTSLGEKIVGLSTDPRLAKALVLSTIFRCVNPVLTIAASMHTRPPFLDAMENRAKILQIKKNFAGDSMSDHIAQVQIYEAWEQAMFTNAVRTFNYDNRIHHQTLFLIRGLRQQLAENLEDAGLVTSARDCIRGIDGSSDFSHDDQLIKGLLCGALFPNLLRVRQGIIVKNRIRLGKLAFKDMDYNNVLLGRRSVNCTQKTFSSRWLAYFSKARSEQVFIHDSSVVHPLAVLCMTGRQVRVFPVSNQEVHRLQEDGVNFDPNVTVVKLVLGTELHSAQGRRGYRTPVAFFTEHKLASTLMGLINEVNKMVEECLKTERLDKLPPDVQQRHEDILGLLQKVVNSPQAPFIKNQLPMGAKRKDEEWQALINLNLTAH